MYIFLRGWPEQNVVDDDDMEFLESLNALFLEEFWSRISINVPDEVRNYVTKMITEDGVLSIQYNYPSTQNMKVYYDSYKDLKKEIMKVTKITDTLNKIFDKVFKHFIPLSFAGQIKEDNDKKEGLYNSFHMFFHSTHLDFILYKYRDIRDAPEDKNEDHFGFSINLLPIPHLKIQQRLSNVSGNATKMGTQIISIFNKFPVLRYIETDAVNPITYHIAVKQGFKPVCGVGKLDNCLPLPPQPTGSLLGTIHDKYTNIISGSTGGLDGNRRQQIASLYEGIESGIDLNEFKGVKLRLFKYEEGTLSGGKAAKKTQKSAPEKTTKSAPNKTQKSASKKPPKSAPNKTPKSAPKKPTKSAPKKPPKSASKKKSPSKEEATGRIHTGPRGGEYMIRNGRKVYI